MGEKQTSPMSTVLVININTTSALDFFTQAAFWHNKYFLFRNPKPNRLLLVLGLSPTQQILGVRSIHVLLIPQGNVTTFKRPGLKCLHSQMIAFSYLVWLLFLSSAWSNYSWLCHVLWWLSVLFTVILMDRFKMRFSLLASLQLFLTEGISSTKATRALLFQLKSPDLSTN